MPAPNELPPVQIGCVQYLNARPLIHGWPGKVRFDHPSSLCRALAAGELDVALVSSFEYLRNPVYAVVDGLAIASDGPVYSVFLAHRGPLDELREVVVDPASETSVNLLRCWLGRNGFAPAFVARGALDAGRGRLLIGDQAIRFRAAMGEGIQLYDLGAAWKEMTALPFVFALWLLRPDFNGKEKVAHALRHLAKTNLAQLDQIIAALPKAEQPFCEFYFRQCLRFSFGEEEKKGFHKFAELCAGQKLLPSVPPPPALV